jgi:sugar phosphate isomerase/epimerase
MLPHLLFGQASDVLWITGATDTVDVSTCLDTRHAYLSGDMKNVLSKLSGHLRMIHANDNSGSNNDQLPPGRGNIDWEWMLQELFKTDFVDELYWNWQPHKTQVLFWEGPVVRVTFYAASRASLIFPLPQKSGVG